MKKFLQKIIDLLLSRIHKGVYVWVDGMYNMVVLSDKLYKHLLLHSRMGRDNRILVFITTHNGEPKYCFCSYKSVEPIIIEDAATCELQLSKEHLFIGFKTELVQNMLQAYGLSPTDVSKLLVIPRNMVHRDNDGRAIHRYVYYELQKPKITNKA